MKHARSRFDELARTKCTPLYEGWLDEGVRLHKLPPAPSDVEDDGQFRVVLLGADCAGTSGGPPDAKPVEFLRTHSSPSDNRTYQNVVLVVTPSITGLHHAEQQIAEWMAWEEIESSNLKELDSFQQEHVRRRKRDTHKDAQTAVKNSYELVLYIDKDGAAQAKKITLGAQSLMATLLQESALRLFLKKIDAEAIMPTGLYPVWPAGDPSVRVSELYQEFGKSPKLPKLLSAKTVLNTIEDAVQRGVLALRCPRSDGSEQFFWRSRIDVADWGKTAEAWLPASATLNSLTPSAVLPDSLPGLWPKDDSPVKLSEIYAWFDGEHSYEEQTEPGYPPEARPIPKVEFNLVKMAVAKAVEAGALWLVFGNDSVLGESPAELQLDADASLYRPPEALKAIQFLPANLPGAWSNEAEPIATAAGIYGEIKAKSGKPWPTRQFLETLNAAIGQGFLRRVSGSGPVSSLQHEGSVELIIKSEAPKPIEPTPISPGRRASTLAVLNIAEVQDFADQIHTLTKSLAGCDPQIEIRISLKDRGDANLPEASKILEEIKAGWKF